jgi:hypothetical protein
MLSTANALIEATQETVFDDEVIDMAKLMTKTHSEMSQDDFAKMIYLYSGLIASVAIDKATKVLLTKEQIIDLMVSIGEMQELTDEVLNG